MANVESSGSTDSRIKAGVSLLTLLKLIALPIVWLILEIGGVASATEGVTQQVFDSPAKAVQALVAAAKSDDVKALNAILGPEAAEVVSSGDPVADNQARENFVRRFGQMRRLAFDENGNVILYIGADNWPVAVPLVHKGSGWIFDTPAGKDELLFRRIGENELFTIDVLEDLVSAQHEYASEHSPSSQAPEFAQKIVSDKGKKNGLFWPEEQGQGESPMGPRFARAANEGYEPDPSGKSVPFHGYYYKVLTGQGAGAPGGEKSYIQDGKMTGGFAFVAYPADYGSSGIMTFMVNEDGVIVEKDLGDDTEKLAQSMSSFNPDGTWDEETAD